MIKTDLIHKYKDREPLETVKIISNFFRQNQFETREVIVQQSSVFTWWCRIELWSEKIKLLGANGKGTTKEYALASGYSELYERFCGGYASYADPFIAYKCNLKNYNNNKWFLHPEEKEISFNEVRNSCKKFQDFFTTFSDCNNYILKFHNLQYNKNEFQNTIITVPFKNFNNNSIKYFEPILVHDICGSDGLAAGNTLNEALVQGLSECYEHYCIDNIYNNLINRYYQIDLSNVKLPVYLNNIKRHIEENNFLYLYDLSYNLQVPVIMGVLINKQTHGWVINLGCHPILNIAIERVFTELYQGISDEQNFCRRIFNIPFKNNNENIEDYGHGTEDRLSYPEQIITNPIVINHFNNNIFLDNATDNKELIEYLKQINILNNFNVYYYDYSLSKDIFAIQVFIDNIPIFLDKYNQSSLYLSNNIKNQFLENEYYFYLGYFNLLKTNKNNNLLLTQQLINYKQNILNLFFNNPNIKLLESLLFSGIYTNILVPITNNIDEFFNDIQIEIQKDFINYLINDKYNILFLIYLYSQQGYDKNYIQGLLKSLKYNNINFDEDFNNYNNQLYLYSQILEQSFLDFYNNKLINNLENILVNQKC